MGLSWVMCSEFWGPCSRFHLHGKSVPLCPLFLLLWLRDPSFGAKWVRDTKQRDVIPQIYPFRWFFTWFSLNRNNNFENAHRTHQKKPTLILDDRRMTEFNNLKICHSCLLGNSAGNGEEPTWRPVLKMLCCVEPLLIPLTFLNVSEYLFPHVSGPIKTQEGVTELSQRVSNRCILYCLSYFIIFKMKGF